MPSALPPLASVQDLADWIGEPIEANTADFKRAVAVLGMASSIIRSKQHTDRTWVDTTTGHLVADLPDIISQVCVQAAARKYTNPDDLEQERQDDFYASRRVEEAGVYLTEAEKAAIAQYAQKSNRGIGTVQVTRDDYPSVYDGELTGPPILPPYYL